MAYDETHFEQHVSSVDAQLSSALTQLDQTMMEAIRLKVGEEAYQEYMTLQPLDASLDASLSDDLKTLLVQQRAEALEHALAGGIPQLDDPESAFDEDEERTQVESAYHAAASRIVEMPTGAPTWQAEVLAAFEEVSVPLADDIELLLANHYPELVVAALDEASITVCLRGLPVDYEHSMNKTMRVEFSAKGEGLATRAAYMYTPLSHQGNTSYEHEVDLATAGDSIENISLTQLKADILLAVRTVLKNTAS